MILYLLKFTLCSSVLLLFYKVVLEREKVLRFNRLYLLGSLMLSLVLPLVTIEVPSEQDAALPTAEYFTSVGSTSFVAEPTTAPLKTTPTERVAWMEVLGVIYLFVTGYLLLRFLRNSITLINRARRNEMVEWESTRLVLLDAPILPHSFLNYIFLNRAKYLSGAIEAEILRHERAHVRQRHSLDVFFVELLRAVLWINPALYFYRQSMVLNHEFLADAEVLSAGRSTSAYQHLLLRQSARPPKLAFVSQFNFSFIKKRFAMMNKRTSRTRSLLLKVAVLPMLGIAIYFFSDRILAQNNRPDPSPAPTTQQKKVVPVAKPSDPLSEYRAIVAKYVAKLEPKHYKIQPSESDAKRLEFLTNAIGMRNLRSRVDTIMLLPFKPLSLNVPTQEEFEKYKNPKMYGVWIDDKKVHNTKLNDYKASDFSRASVSKLYLNAQKTIGYKYKYQVNMMTTSFYEKHRQEALNDKRWYIQIKRVFDKPKK